MCSSQVSIPVALVSSPCGNGAASSSVVISQLKFRWRPAGWLARRTPAIRPTHTANAIFLHPLPQVVRSGTVFGFVLFDLLQLGPVSPGPHPGPSRPRPAPLEDLVNHAINLEVAPRPHSNPVFSLGWASRAQPCQAWPQAEPTSLIHTGQIGQGF